MHKLETDKYIASKIELKTGAFQILKKSDEQKQLIIIQINPKL